MFSNSMQTKSSLQQWILCIHKRAHLINDFVYILIQCKQTCKLKSWFQCVFQFYAKGQTHKNQLHLIYLNSMRTNNTSMNFCVFQFHVNKQTSPNDNEFHCMQTTPFEPIGSYSIQKKKKKTALFFCYIEDLNSHNQTSKFDNKFQCIPIPRKKPHLNP